MLNRHRIPLVRFVAALLLVCAMSAGAQVLARPGWTGSGMSTELWWRGAVFYRIAPEHFQDSDDDGVGDLRGIAQRLDYLQTLGVDAIVLQLPFDDSGFDDLQKELTQRHLRLVIGLDRGSTESALPAAAARWLARGAAGVLLPPAANTSASDDTLVQTLRQAVARMPGERVLITSATPAQVGGGAHEGKSAARGSKSNEPQLVVRTLPLQELGAVTPAAVDAALNSVGQTSASESVLQLAPSAAGATAPNETPNNAAIAVAALLTQRSAVLLEYGEELGEPAPERMPWTPGNVTLPPPPPEEPAKPSAPAGPFGPEQYGAYHEYVPPPPKPKTPPPPAPGEVVLPDPATLPGFSTKAPADKPVSGGVRPVVLQERDPLSTLNLYKKLLGMHRGNEAMRKGTLEVLHGQEELVDGSAAQGQTAAWLRHASNGTIVFAVNCGDTPVRLSLEGEFARLHLGEGFLRSTFSPGQVQGRKRLLLAPHAVFVGEFVRGY